MTLPSFSIVIPTYQRREIVARAVRALASLEYRGKIELIVVVDGSTDGTADALRAVELPFPVSVIEQANAGAGAARNRGAAAASGEVLLFLDDDMICTPELLTEHARSHAEGADAVVGDFVFDEGSLAGFHSDNMATWFRRAGQGRAARGEVRPCDFFSGQMSIRREVFNAVGGFDETFTSDDKFAGEDCDLGASLRNHKVVHNARALTSHVYVVTPSELMARAFTSGRGGALFLSRHPELSGPFFADTRKMRPWVHLLARRIGRVPGLARLLAGIVGRAGDLVLRTKWRSNARFAHLFNTVRNIAYWSALDRGLDASYRRSVTVLCYHAIADHSADPVLAPYGIPPERFRQQIDWLSRSGYTFLSPQQFLDFLDGRRVPPRKSILLTFDDCYTDLADAVRDVLGPRQIPSLAFCVAAIPSNSNEWDTPKGAARQALLPLSELAALQTDGLEVGSHGLTHRSLPTLAGPEMIAEISEPAGVLQRAGLPRPRFFAYPFGAHDHASREEVRRAGFDAAFGVSAGRADRMCDRFDVPRVSPSPNDQGLRLSLRVNFPVLYDWLVARAHSLRQLRR